MNSICKFISKKGADGELFAHRFVYETDTSRFERQTIAVTYIFYIIMSGDGLLEIGEKHHKIERGTAFFIFPGQEYRIIEGQELTITYISFSGERAGKMLHDIGVTEKSDPVNGLTKLCDFTDNTIRRVNDKSGKYLVEAVLLYAVAEISDSILPQAPLSKNENLFGSIMDYIERHYTDCSLSLKKLGEIYSYSNKYISALIRSNLGIGFSEYITRKRMENAKKLINEGGRSISDIAFFCGYSDPLYFSKVFKHTFGMSPKKYIATVQPDYPDGIGAEIARRYID